MNTTLELPLLPVLDPGLEHERLESLRSLELLDTPREDRFDRITELAANYFRVPISYVAPALRVRLRYFTGKYHAYLAFHREGAMGRQLARELAQYIRAQTVAVQGPVRRRAIALYYPSLAFCYFLLSGTAFYTLWQLVKRY